jgi:hypothetical protein
LAHAVRDICAFMANFTDINRGAQECVKRATRERLRARPRAITREAKLGVQTVAVEFSFEQPHAANFRSNVGRCDARLSPQTQPRPTVAGVLRSRVAPNLPSTFLCVWKPGSCLGCARRLPRARIVQTTAHVQCQSTHRRREVELLGDRHEGNLVAVKDLHHSRKI